MELRSVLQTPEVHPLQVEFNKRFKIEPPKGFSRFVLDDPYGWGYEKQLVKIPFLGKEGTKGDVEIRGYIIPVGLREGEKVILPAGDPIYNLSLDEVSGLTVVKALPINFVVKFGPVSEDQIQSGQVGVSLFCSGREYQAKPSSLPFAGDSEPRDLLVRNEWVDLETGKVGPMFLPSGADFEKIEFVIKKNSR